MTIPRQVVRSVPVRLRDAYPTIGQRVGSNWRLFSPSEFTQTSRDPEACGATFNYRIEATADAASAVIHLRQKLSRHLDCPSDHMLLPRLASASDEVDALCEFDLPTNAKPTASLQVPRLRSMQA